MSLLSKIFGGGDWRETAEAARKLEDDGDPGDALLAYEKLLSDHRGDMPPAEAASMEARAVTLRDRIADGHLAEAGRLLGEGDVEAAREELKTALDVAGTPAKEQEVQARLDALEAGIARALVEDDGSPSEEETFQALSGGWDEDQFDEYEALGPEFRKAYLDFNAGRISEAAVAYAGLVEKSGDDALFVLFELGRARAACGALLAADGAEAGKVEAERKEAVDALSRFLERLPDDMTPPLRAAAWNELAQIHLERKDHEAAEDALMRAQEAVPGEPAAYLNLGRFLMVEGRKDEAVDALEQGVEVMDKLRPDWRLLGELGLAYRAAGKPEEAIGTLRSVVETLATIHEGFYDPRTTQPLAQLLEEKGDLSGACTLYRHLAEVGDPAGLAEYNLEAARLLAATGEHALMRNYIARARELAGTDELKTRIAELEKGSG